IKLTGLYPNPATEEVTISIDAPSAERITLVVTDIYGKQIMQQNITVEVGSNNTKLNVGRLSSGIYLIQLRSTKTNTNSVLKLVKH
ncbi:MAG: T9SS type A sorting domain-containing protein, partial [Chitinophagaceae bacterium]|nr:T9SS type A sorting domain-containing protein [Chitinophagaceae bacterium]